MDAATESNQNNAHCADNYTNEASHHPTSPMEDIKHEDISMISPMPLSSTPKQRPTPLKGSKSSNMLRSVTAPHPLSLSSSHSSLHHFQTSGSPMYTTAPASVGFTSTNNGLTSTSSSSSSIYTPNTPVGPLSAPSSPSFPNSVASGPTVPPSFMAMHGHNSSLYEPFRRNSVPILTVDQAEHKRKASEEKHMHRQGSWSSLTSNSPSLVSGPMSGMVSSQTPPGLHHIDAAHLDPATMHYYRTQFSQQHALQQQQLNLQQHTLSQVMPSSNSSNCPSPMPDGFMTGSSMHSSHLSSGSSHHGSTTGAIRGNNTKVKRNNSICSTTSISSTGSGSNNKHPCKHQSCEWSFKRFEHLKRHMLVHTKERPFQCDFAGCNKSFSRSDNFSAHLRTHSKKALAHRRYDSRGLETGGSGGIKQESQDSSQSLSSSAEHGSGGMAGFMPHPSLHLPNSYSTGSISQDASEYGRDYSPPPSPGGTPMGRPSSAMGTSSSMNDDDSFDMMGHSGYSFGNSSMYALDHLDHLNSMVPRFDSIRLDLKSVNPGDIHKQYDEANQSEVLLSSSNPNGESPRASPLSQYEHFSFPSSISTHFIPMMPPGFSSDSGNNNIQQQQHSQHQHSTHHSGGFSSEPDFKSLHFSHGSHGAGGDSDFHYSPSPPSNEDSSHLHHPQPYQHASYQSKVAATPQMLQHSSYGSLPPLSTSAALPPHPLMSMSSSLTSGLNEVASRK
ncbi:hypothetical protein EC957_008339 [Mortierella hygrophila]|uniref:C2H2-type domain-containing protein n=1 Tax=Mortierella hygrophila TaxID=979708 RepID=A0A9P6K5P3_9FUNG|nr:hypothetical protein EC957_008339 [Mortierella hygrophila]